jgi:hypothetical protein
MPSKSKVPLIAPHAAHLPFTVVDAAMLVGDVDQHELLGAVR